MSLTVACVYLQKGQLILSYPRLLLLDMTPIGGPAATGALKETYLSPWPEDALLHMSALSDDRFQIAAGTRAPVDLAKATTPKDLVEAFRPQIVLYRPVDDVPSFHRFSMETIEAATARGTGLAVWLMDDWPARAGAGRSLPTELMKELATQLVGLVEKADLNLAISTGMAAAFSDRYKRDFEIVHNAVDLTIWPPVPDRRDAATDPFVIRYAGSLAPDTTSETVLTVARAVASLVDRGENIRLEIKTQAHWMNTQAGAFRGIKGVEISLADLAPAEYRDWLQEADALLLGYNFDETTKAYLRVSFANKLPELLAAARPILAVGPTELETIAYCRDHQLAYCVDHPEMEKIADAILALSSDASLRVTLARRARAHANEAFALGPARQRFVSLLNDIANDVSLPEEGFARENHVQLEECALVHQLYQPDNGAGGAPVMVDVGAHVGSSLAPFLRDGWRVFAFEPDSKNREGLMRNHGDASTLTIFDCAVGAEPAKNVAFFTSDVSTGISGLNAFHPSHKASGTVATTTLVRLIAGEGLTRIDLLKIDVEGHEHAVLDGLDFTRLKPSVIVAEYDDGKKSIAGDLRGAKALADRLQAEGYTVFASEWHPIEQYGGQHSWSRLIQMPADLPPEGWGNFIAFQDPPSEESLMKALRAVLRGGAGENAFGIGAVKTALQVGDPARTRSFYHRAATALIRHAPGVADALRPLARRLLGRA
ncbi:MAG: FkbM family methyltransferase [Pseudomonadota bacterium]